MRSAAQPDLFSEPRRVFDRGVREVVPQKGITLVLAKADFDGNGRAAPFRANDELLALEPVCVLTLANSLNAKRNDGLHPFGPALNLAQKASERGIRHVPIRLRD